MHRDVGAEEAASRGSGTLGVLSPELGLIAKATTWLIKDLEGQRLLAVPQLYVEQQAAIAIVSGMGLAELFRACKLVTPEWEEIAGFVGGSWQLWKTGQPVLTKVGFVVGLEKFDIERAVRGITKLLT